LNSLNPGERAVIHTLQVSEELSRHLSVFGLRVGKTVQVLRRACFAGPLHIRVDTTDLMLRACDARGITVQLAGPQA
jgi:ferrous iron transport protein A